MAVTSGASQAIGSCRSGDEFAFFLRSRSVDQCGRKSDTTRRIAALHNPAVRISAAHAFQLNPPAWSPQARNAEIFTWVSRYSPTRCGRRSLDGLFNPGSAPEDEGGNARTFCCKLQALGGSSRIFRHLPDHPGKAWLAQTFLHREEHVGVAASLDVNYAVRTQPRQVKGRGEEIAPAEAPENRALYTRENSGKEYGSARLISQIGTARDLVKRAGGYATAWQATINALDPERNGVVSPISALDLRDART